MNILKSDEKLSIAQHMISDIKDECNKCNSVGYDECNNQCEKIVNAVNQLFNISTERERNMIFAAFSKE